MEESRGKEIHLRVRLTHQNLDSAMETTRVIVTRLLEEF